jgi:Tol biopolymer transport system component
LLTEVSGTFAGFQPGATWSPDGRTIAVPLMRFRQQPRFTLYTVTVANGILRELHSSPYLIGRAMWLPEGGSLLLVLDDREGRGQLWAVTFPQGEVERLTNDLTNYRARIDLKRNAETLAAIAGNLVSNIWRVLGADTLKAKQVTSLNLPLLRISETPNGILLANSGDGKLWAFSPDGKERALFTDFNDVGAPTICARFVVLNLYVSGTSEMMRFDADGSNPVKLASGDVGDPVCSPDGRYIYYVGMGPPQKIWRISVSGGPPVEISTVLGENVIGRLSISRDGKFLAYPYEEFTPTPKTKFAIVPADGGPPLKKLDAPAGVYGEGAPLLSPDGKSLEYFLTRNGYSNIWEQPLDGGEPRQLTRFTSGRIFDFNWSVDGKRLLLSRGEVSSDVVLLSNLK